MAKGRAGSTATAEPAPTEAAPAPTTDEGAPPASRAAFITSEPDPFLAAMRPPRQAKQRASGATDDAAPADAAPPRGEPAAHTDDDGATTTTREDGDEDPYAGLDERQVRALLKEHPKFKKAVGEEVRDHLNKKDAENQRLQREAQQLKQQQEANATLLEMLAAVDDADHPKHWEAVDYFKERGVGPVKREQLQQELLGDPEFAAHLERLQAESSHAAILAARDHPALSSLGPEQLEASWQESDGSAADFYARAFRAAGYLSPAEADAVREATRQEERTRLFGEEYPTPDVSPGEGGASQRPRLPTDPAQIDPNELFLRGLKRHNGRAATPA